MTKTLMKPSFISSRLGWPAFLMAVVFFIGLLYHWWPDMPTKHVLIVFVVLKACLDPSFDVSQSISNQCIGARLWKSSVEIPRYKRIRQDVRGRVSEPSHSQKSKLEIQNLFPKSLSSPCRSTPVFQTVSDFWMNLLPLAETSRTI